MGMCLPRFDIYQGKVVLNCFKNHTHSFDLLIFFKKKVLSDVRSHFHLVRRNIVSKERSDWALKNYIQAC